jgi:hypothetical protein
VVYRRHHHAEGPWAIHVLEVDLRRCARIVAVTVGDTALGLARTSELVSGRARSGSARVVGGVNADFFRARPAGLPLGAHVSGGVPVAGPGTWPAVAVDAHGAVVIGPLDARGRFWIGADTFVLAAFNRPSRAAAVYDRAWGAVTPDTAGMLEVAIDGEGRMVLLDTTRAGLAIPPAGAVLSLGPDAAAARDRVAWSAADRVGWSVALTPLHPREAVGGFPVLVRGGRPVAGIDTAGIAGFADGRHPRTALAVLEGGRRVLLVAVDGRQPPYSVGMTLPELAETLIRLGAVDALNLDGGGSTTLVTVDETGLPRVRNRPSDPAGERPVSNALVVESGCG